jgi:hypothetical protein
MIAVINGSNPMPAVNNQTVVILLSDKRSGSTMFQRELCKHAEIQTVAYSPHTYLETHHWLKGAVLLGAAAETFAGGKIYDGYGSLKNARTYLIDCVKRNVPEFQIPADDRALVFQGWEALCVKFAQPVFFEKSPQILAQWAGLSLLLEWIQQTAFKVKVVGLTRNPLSVQYSAFQLFHTAPEKRQYSWLDTQKNMLAFQSLLPPGVFFHVKYEDIIEQPQATFAGICEFIGVTTSPAIGAQVHAESLTKWKDDPYFTLQLAQPVKQVAAYFGYSETDLENPVKPAPPLPYRLEKAWASTSTLTLAHLKDRLIKPMLLRRGWKSSKHG